MSVSNKKSYGIHWHDRVSFCLPCVILTLRLYGSTVKKKKRHRPNEIEIVLVRSLSALFFLQLTEHDSFCC